MRNLKRALSLAMASVMTLGMMTVGASAKGLNFSDAAEITNVDAATITSDLGIFVGYKDANGNFEFQGKNVVTRAEMAVICAKLLYGADVDPAQFAGINKFTDVPAWAEGWVNLCASLGIIVGRDETTFDPNAPVSTVEASVMLAKTLGYFKNQKDFGSDWKLATTAKATQLGLYGDLKLAADAGLTRDSVAELVFNTMTKAVPVDYNELLGVYYNQNQGIVYALEFNYLQTLGYKNFDLVYKTTEDTVYGRPATTWGTGSYDYKKAATAADELGYALDSNGGLLNDHVILLDRDEIITIPDKATYTYTKGTKTSDIYKALGANVCENYSWDFYVNGKLVGAVKCDADGDVRSTDIEQGYAARPTKVDDTYGYTTKGAVTEIYIDKAEKKVTLCEINYYLGEVTSVKEDDDGEYVNVKALSKEGKILDNKKFYTNELEAEDLVVYTVDHNDDDTYYIPEMFTPGTVTGEVSRVEDKNDTGATYIRLVGETDKYEYASENHIVYDLDDLGKKNHPVLNEDYILYTTPAGYVLAFEKAEETVDQYLWVKDSDEELKDWIAKVTLTDGTTAKVDVKNDLLKTKDEDDTVETWRIADWKADSDGDVDIFWLDDDKYDYDKSCIDERVWKYSVNDKGVYTLTYADFYYLDDMDIHNDEAYISDDDDENDERDVLVNSKTIFVDVANGKSYVGHKNVPNIEDADIAYVTNSKGTAKVVFVLNGTIYDSDATYFFLADTDDVETLKDSDNKHYYEFPSAYGADGEPFTAVVEYSAFKDADFNADGDKDSDDMVAGAGHIYKIVKTNDDGYATKVILADTEDTYVAGSVYDRGDDTFRLTQIEGDTVNLLKFDTDKDTQFVLIENQYKKSGALKGYDVSMGDVDDMIPGKDDEGMTSTVHVVKHTKQTADLVFIHVHAAPNAVAAQLDDNVTGIEIAGLVGGSAAIGQDLVLKLNVAQVKAVPVNGKVYTVVINGQEYNGYGIGGGEVLVKFTVNAASLKDGKVVLRVGDVIATGASYDAASAAFKAIEEIQDASEYVTPSITNDEGTTIRLYVEEVKIDNGYAYTVSDDTVVLNVTKDENGDVSFKLDIKDLDFEDEDKYEVYYTRFGKEAELVLEGTLDEDDTELEF